MYFQHTCPAVLLSPFLQGANGFNNLHKQVGYAQSLQFYATVHRNAKGTEKCHGNSALRKERKRSLKKWIKSGEGFQREMEHTGNENISLQNKRRSTALDQGQVWKPLLHGILYSAHMVQNCILRHRSPGACTESFENARFLNDKLTPQIFL